VEQSLHETGIALDSPEGQDFLRKLAKRS